jgi:hypothetical protein
VVDSGDSKAKARLTSIRKVRSIFARGGRSALSRSFVRRQLWVAPLLAIVGLVFAGTWVRSRTNDAMQQQHRDELKTLLKADVAALELWMDSEKDYVAAASADPEVRQAIIDLVALGKASPSNLELATSKVRAQIASLLAPWFSDGADEHRGYAVMDMSGRILAATEDNLVGLKSPTGYADVMRAAESGKPLVTRPFPSTAELPDEFGRVSTEVPTMFAVAPVKDGDKPVAALGFRIRPQDDFTTILNVARTGKTGETYAFDKYGRLLSASRFEDQLKEIGLMLNRPDARSTLEVEIRDPDVDLVAGGRPAVKRSEQPLTRMASDAIANQPPADDPGVDVVGYRDYRGVDVIGAWCWLPEYDFGVATEVDTAEAFLPFNILSSSFWTLIGLLAAGSLLLLGVTLVARRMERRMREAVIAAGQLGQYALEEKIGEGGMGSVFRGRHAMLRRPTAIKLLEPSKTTDVSIERFEREVQHTSLLNHPNTITIYDYGRTEEGVFYYAMEYLDGFSLQALVERFGAQPDGRVIHILLQVCGSLVEAHSQGLIHRDIKPANIMLTERGGVRDYVKLLDFGLVKAVDTAKQRTLTVADAITGTPLYLSPESIEDGDSADKRSDLYSLGGVAYFLLTGHPVFEGGGVMDIIRQHVEGTPVAPSKRLGRPVSAGLEELVLQCLAKSPSDRPQDAAQVAAALWRCVPMEPWTADDADRWWDKYASGDKTDVGDTSTRPIALARTLSQSAFEPES